ncbi:2-hydroxyacid dehydrogenase [Atopobiaceae bacterium 24-176]
MNIALLEPLSVPDKTIDELAAPLVAAGHSFKAWPTRTTDPAELARRAEGADVVIIANTPFSAAVVEALPKLKLVDVAFTGVDQVDTATCKERGVTVCNCAGYSDVAVAELVAGLTVDVFRRMPEAQRSVRHGGTSQGLMGTEIAGKTVGVVGTGHIGTRVARLFSAFGAKVLGYARHPNPDCMDAGVSYRGLDALLAESDIVTLHLPLTEATRGFIDAEKICAMKKGAVLVNCARGPIVDATALADALTSGHLAGAAVDVFDQEPPLDPANPLLSAPNAVLTPHIGYLTQEAMERRAQIAFSNVTAFCEGNPQNVVA